MPPPKQLRKKIPSSTESTATEEIKLIRKSSTPIPLRTVQPEKIIFKDLSFDSEDGGQDLPTIVPIEEAEDQSPLSAEWEEDLIRKGSFNASTASCTSFNLEEPDVVLSPREMLHQMQNQLQNSIQELEECQWEIEKAQLEITQITNNEIPLLEQQISFE